MGFLQEVEEVVTESTMAFDDILSGPFALYLDLSRKIGGDVATQAEMVNHLSAISESIPALGWVTITPAPGPYVKEMNDAGQFYTNRVLKEFKDKDKTHVEWVKAWIHVLSELQAFIKKHHTTGLTWNTKGGDAMQSKSRCRSAQAPPPPS